MPGDLSRPFDIGNTATAAGSARALELGVDHGHIITLVHIPDLLGDGVTNTALVAEGIAQEADSDGLDPADAATVILALAQHLAQLVDRLGIQGIHVLTGQIGGRG